MTDIITVTGWVEETRFHFLKASLKTTLRTKIGSTSFDIEDEITNLSASPAEVQMLYHMNFGRPLLDAGSQVIAPVSELVPRNESAVAGLETWNSYSAETPGFEEQVYFAKLLGDDGGNTKTLLKNAHGTKGAVLRFNVRQLPCFTLWKNTTSTEDGFVTGIEPGTNFPNPRTFEGARQRVIQLGGNESATLRLGFDLCPNTEAVSSAEAAVQELQSSPAKVHARPLPDWCA